MTVSVSGTGPTAPTAVTASPSTICPGASTTLAVIGGNPGSNGSWQWYLNGCGQGQPFNSGSQISVAPSVTTTYYVQGVGPCGTTACSSVTVNVAGSFSSPAASAQANPSTICAGGATTLSVFGGNLGSNANWRWYAGGCGLNGVGGGASLTVQPTTTTTYYVRAEGDCNQTSCVAVTVTVNTAPAAAGAIAVQGSPCQGGTQTFSIAAVAGASSYNWTYPQGWSLLSGQGTPTLSLQLGTGSGQVCVTPINTCGQGTASCVTVTSNPIPSVSFTGLPGTACLNSGSYNLVGTPMGGSFSGNGIFGNTFLPAVAGVGSSSITYTYTDGYGCANSSTAQVLVVPSPQVALTSSGASSCVDGNPITLIGTPAGGTYSGPGTSGNQFHPAQAGPGPHQINYQYTDGNGCSGTASVVLNVWPLPVVTLSGLPDSVCEDGPTFLLNGTPANGTYSGLGVNSNTFDPQVAGSGLHIANYHYTDSHQCTNVAHDTVRVDSVPVIALTGLPSQICENEGVVPLNVQPTGGSLSGPGISQWSFDPLAAGVGGHTVTYYFMDGHGCDASLTRFIVVDSTPIVQLSAGLTTVCVDGLAIPMLGSPLNGVFSGAGMQGTQFHPGIAGVGTHEILYEYMDGHQCHSSDSIDMVVLPLPIVNQSGLADTLCSNVPAMTLQGSPSPGIFSGPGVSNGQFTASVAGPGTHYVTYYHIDSNGCDDTDMDTIRVLASPTVVIAGLPDTVCLNGSSILLSGAPVGGAFWGAGMSGQVFVPSTAGPGIHAIGYGYVAPSGCAGGDTAVVFVRPAPPAPYIVPASDFTLCNGADTTLVAATGYAGYQWYLNGILFNAGAQVTITQPGIYHVRGLDQFGCGADSPPDTVNASSVQAQIICLNCGQVPCTFMAAGGSGYQWMYAGVPISGANSQFYTTSTQFPIGSGFSVIVTDVNGCSDESPIEYCPVLAIEDSLHQDIGMVAYPNPTTGMVMISISGRYHGKVDLHLVNMVGQVLEEVHAHKSGEKSEYELDLRPYPEAIYGVVVEGKGWRKTLRVVRR